MLAYFEQKCENAKVSLYKIAMYLIYVYIFFIQLKL